MYQPYQDNERMAMQEQDLLARERLKESGYDPRRAGRTSWKRNLLMAPGEILIVLGLVGLADITYSNRSALVILGIGILWTVVTGVVGRKKKG